MNGPPLDFLPQKDTKPVANHVPIPVPWHWHDQVKSELDRDIRLGILAPVPWGTPVLWLSRMLIQLKPVNGKPCRVVDLQNLNEHVEWMTHHQDTPYNLVSMIPRNQFKSILDSWNVYHSIPMSKEA